MWANIFRDTITDSAWLNNKAFSPGRWAVGYPFLYVLYRVLNEIRPKSVLELGVGQSTRVTAQYANAFGDVSHTAVDHDPVWLDFFAKSCDFVTNTNLTTLKLIKPDCYAYDDFGSVALGRKFDLILIDAPFGHSASAGAAVRTDILPFVPDCLAENFVIIVDDFERAGEQAMFGKLMAKLDGAGVAHTESLYQGSKDTVLMTTPGQAFLCTM
ncbi:hypothetical protein FACS1894133_4760 [Clostridia bacterium]|nr:hypothetical protein FACS1894133_4760 [Clostridia bacterium]